MISKEQQNILTQALKDTAQAVRPFFGQAVQSSQTTKQKRLDFGIEADVLAEKIITDAVKSSGLKATIITEEVHSVRLDDHDVVVFVDPIDGTVNFSHGIPVYCHTLAVFSATQEPLFAATYDPNLGEMFTAVRGQGVYINDTLVKRPGHTLAESIHVDWIGAPQIEQVLHNLLSKHLRPRVGGSAALGAAYAAVGRGSAAVMVNNWPWDVAAGVVMAHELGLTVSKLHGEPYDLFVTQKMDTVIAPTELHDRLIKALAKVPDASL